MEVKGHLHSSSDVQEVVSCTISWFSLWFFCYILSTPEVVFTLELVLIRDRVVSP
jgi:hypothetical protein